MNERGYSHLDARSARLQKVMMKIAYWLACGLLLLASCGEINVIGDEDTGDNSNLGAEGTNCGATSDCQQGLNCINNLCTDPSKSGLGENCTKTADCQVGLKCIDSACTSDAAGGDPCGKGPCGDELLGNGDCDAPCNCDATDWDRGDCNAPCGAGPCSDQLLTNGECDDACNCEETGWDNGDCAQVTQACNGICYDLACCAFEPTDSIIENCGGCEPGLPCAPGAPGFDSPAECGAVGVCPPAMIDFANNNKEATFFEMAQCACTNPDPGSFLECAKPPGTNPPPDCTNCFFEYFAGCVMGACAAECNLCAGQQLPPGTPGCSECLMAASCAEQLLECSGGIEWWWP